MVASFIKRLHTWIWCSCTDFFLSSSHNFLQFWTATVSLQRKKKEELLICDFDKRWSSTDSILLRLSKLNISCSSATKNAVRIWLCDIRKTEAFMLFLNVDQKRAYKLLTSLIFNTAGYHHVSCKTPLALDTHGMKHSLNTELKSTEFARISPEYLKILAIVFRN